MAQIFHPSMNIVARATIFGAVLLLTFIAWAGSIFVRSAYVTGAHVARDQPIPFSHQHHVGELGLDCRFCHDSVEKSAFAGMPSTELCMGCHSQIWNRSEVLRPLRDSDASGQPVSWNRVHDLPDFVYFNHSVHVAGGVACESCHGRVDDMPLVRRVATLHMEWCLKCHRHPEPPAGSPSDVFRFGSNLPEPITMSLKRGDSPSPRMDMAAATHKITARRPVSQQLTDCVVCHR